MNVYLATMPLSCYQHPINHGIVDLSDDGFVNGEVPVEDYGCYLTSSSPLPNSERELFELFYDQMTDNTPNSYWCDPI